MRIAAVALALALVAGCSGETLLHVTVDPPSANAAPTELRVTLYGEGFAPASRTFSSVTYPATLVVRGLPATTVCVEVEGLDGAGNRVISGAGAASLKAHATTEVGVLLGVGVCLAGFNGDMGNVDFGGGGDGGTTGGDDLATTPPDAGVVAVCPTGALFCDDFETGDLSKWSQTGVKYKDMGTVAPTMARARHGVWSLEANGSGLSGDPNYVEVEKDFTTALAPPLAVRASFWLTGPLNPYTIIMAFYDGSTHGFALGGDAANNWVLTEDQAAVADHHTSVGVAPGAWHCVEVVVDAGGMVTAYLDGNALVGPFARTSAVSYATFLFGVDRTEQGSTDLFVDDVAIGTSRLYCPP